MWFVCIFYISVCIFTNLHLFVHVSNTQYFYKALYDTAFVCLHVYMIQALMARRRNIVYLYLDIHCQLMYKYFFYSRWSNPSLTERHKEGSGYGNYKKYFYVKFSITLKVGLPRIRALLGIHLAIVTAIYKT